MEQDTKQLFLDFIMNKCSPSQVESVMQKMRQGGYEEEWIAAMEVAEGTLDRESVQLTYKTKLPFNKTYLLRKIQKESGMHSPRVIRWPVAITAAAAVLIVIASLFLSESETADEHSKRPSSSFVKRAEVGKDTQRRWIKLPDGTSVVLNAGSTLEYPENFDGMSQREVSLSGEGFFDVAHDASKPFVIHTGKLKTTVLGTAFNIRAFPSTDSVTVTVMRGKVMVQQAQQTLAILTAEQQLDWVPQNPRATINKKANVSEALAWKAGDLIMDDITLEEAALLITERYQVRVQFRSQNIKGCRFTAAFLNRNELSQVLRVISDITGTEAIIKNNTVYLDGPGCGSL